MGVKRLQISMIRYEITEYKMWKYGMEILLIFTTNSKSLYYFYNLRLAVN
jgi:hypothetical protein